MRGAARIPPPESFSPKMRRLLTGCRMLIDDALVEGHALLLEHGRIAAVLPAPGADVAADETVTLPRHAILAPGFIDVQVNGAGGVLFNDRPSAEAAGAIAAAMRPFGCTGLLPTFITDSAEGTAAACAAAIAAMAAGTPGVLGLHLEGPFLSPARAGIHDSRHIRPATEAELALLEDTAARLARHGGRLLLTLAPEAVDDTVLRRLAEAGIVLAAGHSAASFERTEAALAQGIRGFTHLGNAMPAIVNRDPGPVAAALGADAAWCGVIADGIHIHPGLLRLMLRLKGAERLLLVTDAMPPAGTALTQFSLYGRTILRRDGRLADTEGTLAGADIDIAAAMRNAVALMGASPAQALRMATTTPAEFLGIAAERGRIAAGTAADLVLLSDRLEVLATWIAGASSWHRSRDSAPSRPAA